MIFVDTNYFLRFLLKDIDTQHKKARQLFEEGANGKVNLSTSLIVFFELYWVLSSFYEKQKEELVGILNKILEMEFIKFAERKLLQEALKIFAKYNFDFEDAFNLAYAQNLGVKRFETFDKKLAKIFKGL